MEYEYTFLLKTLHDMSRLCTYTHFHNFFLREEKVYTFYFIYLVLIFFIVIQLQLSAFSPLPSILKFINFCPANKLWLHNYCWKKLKLLRVQKPKTIENKTILHQRKCSSSSQPRIHILKYVLIFQKHNNNYYYYYYYCYYYYYY